eukprot:2032324-Pyramimonas_sp.AAC.1
MQYDSGWSNISKGALIRFLTHLQVNTHQEGVRGAGAARACGAPHAVHEQLPPRGKVKVDDVVQKRNVDAARRDVRHTQHRRLARAKLGHADVARHLPRGSIHRPRGSIRRPR